MSDSRRHFRWLLVALWVIALVVAFSLDRRVAQWVHDTAPVHKSTRPDVRILHVFKVPRDVLGVMKLPGEFQFTVCVAALLAIFHRRHLHAPIALFLTAMIVGIVYWIAKWIAGRHRPVKGIDPFGFHPFPGGLRGLWREAALCFPSGHTLLAFASAMCLAILVPRARWIFFVIAAITAVERVLENAHYVSDVVTGAGVGMCIGWLATRTVLSTGKPLDARPASLPSRSQEPRRKTT